MFRLPFSGLKLRLDERQPELGVIHRDQMSLRVWLSSRPIMPGSGFLQNTESALGTADSLQTRVEVDSVWERIG